MRAVRRAHVEGGKLIVFLPTANQTKLYAQVPFAFCQILNALHHALIEHDFCSKSIFAHVRCSA
jgi:hypothetical protein